MHIIMYCIQQNRNQESRNNGQTKQQMKEEKSGHRGYRSRGYTQLILWIDG